MSDIPRIAKDRDSNFFQNLLRQGKLILRLMGDRRVNFFIKLLPVAALLYIVSPADLLPGIVLPVVGALDDAAVLWIGTTLFLSLCPEEVVREHSDALDMVVNATWHEARKNTDEQIVEAATLAELEPPAGEGTVEPGLEKETPG
jgi:uncharacterized membrane protein YkvA (DUF1232 family)